MNTPPAPRLAPPGAGLPRVELLVARWLFARRARRATAAGSAALIAEEREALGRLARPWDAAAGARPVLVRRLRGMEDSSRFWSVFMTVAHVRIVNRGALGVMRELLAGRVPARPASTAAVKPDPAAGPGEIAELDRSCSELIELGRSAPDLRTAARFAHPWFGPLDAAAWFCLAGVHMALHRRQLELIVAGLG